MEPRLLKYYSQELVHLRDLTGEFARAHPKIAQKLNRRMEETADPYAERLIDAFCFMAARLKIKLDAESPRFMSHLLEVLFPSYVTPTPSMAVAHLNPDTNADSLMRGHCVPRGTLLNAVHVPEGEKTACQFTTSQHVTLWPLAITQAWLTGVPDDIAMLDRYVAPGRKVRGALRLRLSTTNGARMADLQGLDSLPVYLSGDAEVASRLFELLHIAGMASITGAPGEFSTPGHWPSVVMERSVTHLGFGLDEGLLPLAWTEFHGHNLLREYFSCPQRFWFFSLNGLAPGLGRINSTQAEIVLLLDQPPGELTELVDESRFSLFCTPVVNLFRRTTDRIEVTPHDAEIHLVPARLAPLDYEIFSVDRVFGYTHGKTITEQEFRPLYQTINSDTHDFGRYFSVRRERRVPSDMARRYGTRTAYEGTEIFLSLVDQNKAPYDGDIRFLAVDAMLTNRDLPTLIPRDGLHDLRSVNPAPIEGIGLIRPPTPPAPPYAEHEMTWRLIRLMDFSCLPLESFGHREGGQALRDLLRMYLPTDDDEHRRQVESLVGVRTQPVIRKLPGVGPLVSGRGVECTLTVDESGFSGSSPYLFGLLIEQYLSRHAAINSFTQTELRSMQRGRIFHWPARFSARGVV